MQISGATDPGDMKCYVARISDTSKILTVSKSLVQWRRQKPVQVRKAGPDPEARHFILFKTTAKGARDREIVFVLCSLAFSLLGYEADEDRSFTSIYVFHGHQPQKFPCEGLLGLLSVRKPDCDTEEWKLGPEFW
jgi:hypothetical protein